VFGISHITKKFALCTKRMISKLFVAIAMMLLVHLEMFCGQQVAAFKSSGILADKLCVDEVGSDI
jgi:hypothetical protein